MSAGGFSRRDLLNLGGKIAMSIGAAKLVVMLPGCGDGGGTSPDAPKPDAGPTLDDCHSLGTYRYSEYYPANPNYPARTYHAYFTKAYGCPFAYYLPDGLSCYLDRNDWAPGYPYFCYGTYYTTVSFP